MMGKIWNGLQRMKAASLMVTVQIAYAGANVFYKLAANDGMSMRIIVAYRFLFASAFVLPLAFFIERKSRPKITRAVLFHAFLCGLFGGLLTHNLYSESLALTSATFASAMSNLLPAITFILALSCRLERLNIGTLTGKAKVAGTLVGMCGAMLLTFYKGFEVDIWSTHIDLLHHNHHPIAHVLSSKVESNSRLLGGLLSVACWLSYAIWLIIQTKMSEMYPCHYSSSALMCVMAAVQCVVFALCIEKDLSRWKLGWNVRLLTVAYQGIVASGLAVMLISWCVHMKGPLYVSVFNPLLLVLVALAGSLFLGEKLSLGCIVGAVLIVCGLYLVLWGKGREMKMKTQETVSDNFQETELKNVVMTCTLNDVQIDVKNINNLLTLENASKGGLLEK